MERPELIVVNYGRTLSVMTKAEYVRERNALKHIEFNNKMKSIFKTKQRKGKSYAGRK
jgi:hypothetical protein